MSFVTVSDDTGLVDVNEDLPHLFLMSESGEVQSQPLVMDGVDKITDLEGITATGDGTLYAVTSHGRNRKGYRKKHRRRLLRLNVENGRLAVTGEIDLWRVIRDSRKWRALGVIGQPALKAFEIEGLTSWQGDLYFGLKNPVSKDGEAIIWRLPNPTAAFAGKRLRMELWGKIDLSHPGAPEAAFGIAELLFLGDGSLLIAAAPTKDPELPTDAVDAFSRGDSTPGMVRYTKGWFGGHLVLVRAPRGGLMTGASILSLPKRRVEGLALTADRRRVLAVVDNGPETPEFVTLDVAQIKAADTGAAAGQGSGTMSDDLSTVTSGTSGSGDVLGVGMGSGVENQAVF